MIYLIDKRFYDKHVQHRARTRVSVSRQKKTILINNSRSLCHREYVPALVCVYQTFQSRLSLGSLSHSLSLRTRILRYDIIGTRKGRPRATVYDSIAIVRVVVIVFINRRRRVFRVRC